MSKRVLIGMGVGVLLLLGSPAMAQNTAAVDPSQLTTPLAGAAPADVASLIRVCEPVIDAQYKNSQDRRGQCVGPTGQYLNAKKATTPPAGMGQVVADTVTELVKLYKPCSIKVSQPKVKVIVPGQARLDNSCCIPHETELPEAIALTETFTTDDVQINALKSIAAAVESCQNIATGAINPPTFASPV